MNAHEAKQTWLYLKSTNRQNIIRIRTLGWKRLAKLYDTAPADSPLRKAIINEARRCGYTPGTILACNR